MLFCYSLISLVVYVDFVVVKLANLLMLIFLVIVLASIVDFVVVVA